MVTFNDLKQGDKIYIANKFGKRIYIIERKVQESKNSAQIKNGKVIKPVQEKTFVIPPEFRDKDSYSGDQYSFIATSGEAMKKIVVEYAKEQIHEADKRISYAKEQLDYAVNRRNEINEWLASVIQ